MTAVAPSRLYRFTVEEYHALSEAGVLGEDDRVELIDGLILAMSPIGSTHLLCVNRLERLLARRVYAAEPPLALVSVQNPLRLDDGTEPQPDVVLLHPASEGRFPHAVDALLVVEVADTTEAFDREVKLPRYAAAGVPEVWLVLPGKGVVEQHRRPGPAGYADVTPLDLDGTLSLAALPDVVPIPVSDVLGGSL